MEIYLALFNQLETLNRPTSRMLAAAKTNLTSRTSKLVILDRFFVKVNAMKSKISKPQKTFEN